MNILYRRSIVFLILAGGITAATASLALATTPGNIAADEVSMTSYVDFMDNWLYTHIGDNRGYGAEHDLARDNIEFLFETYGLTVTLEPFTYLSTTYYNVVGTKLGTVYPDQVYIIGAHYDSVDNPGADDDASGVALVLEAARIVTQYDSDYTIRFIGFDREEQGLVGSSAYVSAHISDDIVGMVQLDMVAYDPNTDLARIYQRSGSAVAAALATAVDEYGNGLASMDPGWNGQSDHAPFDSAGFDACMLIESEVWNNPYYHSSQDTFEQPGNLNFPYAVKMTRSLVGWLVDAAGVAVPYDALGFTYPDGHPEYIAPLGGTTLRVQVTGLGNGVPVPDTGMLHFNRGIGWESALMDVVSPNVYDAVFPEADCGREVLYYLSAQETGGDTFTDPWNAPTIYFSRTAIYGVSVSLEDDFETDQGWFAENLGATSGDWQRGVPVNDPGWDYDPAADADGSGQCYLTQNQAGNTDVDDGAVRLTSPIFEIPEGGTIGYDYFLRLTDTGGGVDQLLVEANNTGGLGRWTVVAVHDTDGGMSWRHHDITTADLAEANVPLTSTMRLRFTVNDGEPQSIVESGLDAFSITKPICCPGPPDGDMNGDLFADGDDLHLFVEALLTTPDQSAVCHADFSENDSLGLEDIPGMVAALLEP